MFRLILGIVLVVSGVGIGFYLGFWFLFIGGIVDIIEQIKGDVGAMTIAFGIAKVLFSSFIGTVVGCLIAFPGVILISEGE